MESVLLKVIWYLVHLIVNLFETIYYFGLEFRENFHNFITNITKDKPSSTKESELQLIESSVQDLEKIPKHIIVILNINNEKDVDLSQLTNLIYWSMNSGVNFISFYDYKGIVKHQLASSLHHIISKKLNISDNENIVWGPNYLKGSNSDGVKFPHRNGYRRHIVINLYSSDDGYGKFNELLTDELYKKATNFGDDETLNSRNITIDKVDRKLSKLFGNIPDPELAIYFGNITCTAGVLPWHIRLTEFIQIAYKQHHLSLDKYLRVLHKYARCEQRFGK
ncbi:unnamed protein product [Chironomus riparius]|uniref:ditrans,polycis-polyprenyl diphosphate synthase [(2E,6E)-farnesyldiphosphate specific] n=1 Tax=Chironomus riparius TaxID=315576 RepID=A0A9N9WPY1_9DIPT|nr:unnamed protein product [Chironomus riparius]